MAGQYWVVHWRDFRYMQKKIPENIKKLEISREFGRSAIT